MLERLKRADIPQELVFGWPRSVLLGDEKLIVEQHQAFMPVPRRRSYSRRFAAISSSPGRSSPFPVTTGTGWWSLARLKSYPTARKDDARESPPPPVVNPPLYPVGA